MQRLMPVVGEKAGVPLRVLEVLEVIFLLERRAEALPLESGEILPIMVVRPLRDQGPLRSLLLVLE